VILQRTEEIATGLERAIAFLSTSLKGDGQMKAVYTCGGGSRTPGLTESLGQRLKKPVELANPLTTMSVRDGALESLVTDEVAPLLMLAIGLALRKN
jgi:type IV pilus assembly protein PilM